MRVLSGVCSCGRIFSRSLMGPSRIYCDHCRTERRRAKSRLWHHAHRDAALSASSEWYRDNRADNPAWIKENKRRAKAWRAKNKAWIAHYRKHHSQNSQPIAGE